MSLLREEAARWQTPAVTIVSQREGNPFKVLISCILSLRTKDQTTGPASERLFALADTPAAMLALSQEAVERAIYPVGFYRNKAGQILDICRILLERHEGRVPDDIDQLLGLKGVGRKTANLVVTLGFGKPGICVDTHVHRICNRWGYVSTRNPEETERALRVKLPAEHWLEINDLLVTYGQNLCRPLSPHCSVCRLAGFCDRIGVDRSR
jgi:endonuclease-3